VSPAKSSEGKPFGPKKILEFMHWVEEFSPRDNENPWAK